MTTFEILLQQIGLFVIYILAGVILVRTKVLNKETLEPISKFVIKMALPVMIFINIIDGVNKEILFGSCQILLIAAGFYVVMFLVSLWMTKFFHLAENRAGIYQAMMLFGNIGFMAVPVISNVFPGNGILYVSVFMIFDQFMLWTLGVKLTTPKGSGRFDPKKLINPATVAILIGMILMLTEVRIPSLLDTGLRKIGATASPLAMIYIGGIFAELPLKKYLKELSLYGIVLVRMLLAPLLMFLVLGFFPVNGEIRLAMALVTGMPTMTAVVMMANASGLDGDYALGGVFITTLCGIVTLPCICWLLQYVI